MTRIKCHYIETEYSSDPDDSGCYPTPNERFFEKDYKRVDYTGKMLRLGSKTIWAYPPEHDPMCMYPYDRILYLEIDGHVIIDDEFNGKGEPPEVS